MAKHFRILRSDGVVEIYRQSEANVHIYVRCVLDTNGREPGLKYTMERAVDGEWRRVGLV